MEFKSRANVAPPKNLYPCLATITITPTPERSRRLSSSSQAEDDGNALRRVISGNRRKTSFGAAAVGGTAEDRRKSIEAGRGQDEVTGKWYWRVQAGANDTHLVLLPLSQPANALLTVAPQPLSQAMPGHSATASRAKTSMPGVSEAGQSPSKKHEGDESLTTKFKNLFHIGSSPKSAAQQLPEDQGTDVPVTGSAQSQTQGSPGTSVQGAGADTVSNVYSTTSTAVEDKILDQAGGGQQLPTPEANRLGATNLNANAETEWPGVIKGEKLGAVMVDLRSVDKSKIVLGGGKKGDGSWVIVPINSHFLTLVHPMLESVGKSHHDFPKSGSIRFDFDKDWIGAKGEAELLHHYITRSLENLSAPTSGGHRDPPQTTALQLGQGATSNQGSPAKATGATGPGIGDSAIAENAGPTMTSTSTGAGETAANVDLAKEVPVNK